MRAARIMLALAMLTAPAAMAQEAGSNAPVKLERFPGGDFTLTDHNGARFQLASLRGKVVLLFFGYTSCTEACPIALAKVRAAYRKLGNDAKQVRTVFVSVDPARDTAESLRKYLSYFKVDAIGLTGANAQIDSVVRQYEAKYEIEKSDSALGYHIKHTTFLFLVDQEGAVRYRFAHTDNSDRLSAGIRQLLRGDGRAAARSGN